jgi:acetolactate synthase-1/2/3 large subunit
LLFVGQIPHEDAGRDAFQEVDYRRMFSPLAKWVTQIDQAKRIPEIVAHATDVAVSGRPGPVVIALSAEMPQDVVEAPALPRAVVSPPPPIRGARARHHARPCTQAACRAWRLVLDRGRPCGYPRLPRQ